MGSPDLPKPLPTPAARPERRVDVETDDIQLGGSDNAYAKPKGKKSLMRPTGSQVQKSTALSGLRV